MESDTRAPHSSVFDRFARPEQALAIAAWRPSRAPPDKTRTAGIAKRPFVSPVKRQAARWVCKRSAAASLAGLSLEHRALHGVGAIARSNGTLYGIDVFPDKFHRTPVEAAGAAEQSADLRTEQIALGLGGGRATNGKLLLSGNGSGTILVITSKDGKASVRGIIGVRKKLAAAKPSAGRFWTTSRGTGNPVPMPK